MNLAITRPPALADTRPARDPNTPRRAKIAGALILAAFLLYGGGRALVGLGDLSARPLAVGAGTLLVIVNSVAVVGIGVLFRPILARVNPPVANAYAGTRFLEAALLALGTVVLVVGQARAWDAAAGFDKAAYASAMAVLGAGSLFFCAVARASPARPARACVVRGRRVCFPSRGVGRGPGGAPTSDSSFPRRAASSKLLSAFGSS